MTTPDLRGFLALVEHKRPADLVEVTRSVSPKFETAAIVAKLEAHRRSPILLFRDVEGSPLPLVTALVGRGIATAMPETPAPGIPLVFRRWAPGDDLVDGPYGTKQPSAAADILTPSLILAPMLAFDSGFRRLGYGGGFYDRTLGALRGAGRQVTAIGIAFDGQLVDKVPAGPYDAALDAVLTPSGLRPADNQQPGGA